MDETAPNSPQGPEGENISVEKQQPQFEQAQVDRIKAEILAQKPGEIPGVSSVLQGGGIKAETDFEPQWGGKGTVPEIRNQLNDPNAEPDPNQLSPEERAFREAQYSRGGKMTEILRREREPLLLREAMRNYLAAEEREVYLGARRPSEYVFENVERVIEDRMNELKMAYFRSLEIVKDVRIEGAGRDRRRVPVLMDKEEIAGLFEELEALHDEFKGRVANMDLHAFKQQFAGDVNGFLGMLEVRGGARCPQARYFTLMGRLSGGMGEGVNTGLHEWVNIAENKVKGHKNSFAEYFYADNLQRSINYIAGKIMGREIPDNLTTRERLELGKEYDDAVNTAVLALGLFKNFDFHLTYSVYLEKGKNGRPDRLASSVSQVDATKASRVGLRQLGEEDRDHPYNAGLPLAAGVFPNLIRNFFETVCVKMDGRSKTRDVERRVDLWQLWREDGVPLGDLPLDREHWEEAIGYFQKRFEDENIAFNRDEYDGMYEHAWLIPYKLAHDYAGSIFNLIFGAKLKDVQEVAMNPDAMWSLNKAFGLGFEITWSSSTMTSDDIEAMRQFTKVVWLAEVVHALTLKNLQEDLPPMDTREQRLTAPFAGKNAQIEGDVKPNILVSAKESGFLSPLDSDKPEDNRLAREIALFEKIIREKRALMPHELVGTYFKDKAQVSRIYRSGAYDYNPNLWNVIENEPASDPKRQLLVELMGDRHKILKDRLIA